MIATIVCVMIGVACYVVGVSTRRDNDQVIGSICFILAGVCMSASIDDIIRRQVVKGIVQDQYKEYKVKTIATLSSTYKGKYLVYRGTESYIVNTQIAVTR